MLPFLLEDRGKIQDCNCHKKIRTTKQSQPHTANQLQGPAMDSVPCLRPKAGAQIFVEVVRPRPITCPVPRQRECQGVNREVDYAGIQKMHVPTCQ